MAIELKSPVGKLSPDQKKWLQHAERQGWVVGVVRTLDQHISLVHSFLDGTEFRDFPGYAEIFR